MPPEKVMSASVGRPRADTEMVRMKLLEIEHTDRNFPAGSSMGKVGNCTLQSP